MIAPIPEHPENSSENSRGREAEHAPAQSQNSSSNSANHSQNGEKLANEIEHLFEHQDELLRKVHVEQGRLTSALRELATAMEFERKARNEQPHGRDEDV